jgi:uncharacterized tellurite resistance protein B-like protein
MYILFGEEEITELRDLIAEEYGTNACTIEQVVEALRRDIRESVVDKAVARRMEHRILFLQSLALLAGYEDLPPVARES